MADGTQTVTATVSATTPDPDQANNIASASEATQPAQVGIYIEGDPTNPPPPIDITTPGTAGWLGVDYNAANPNLWPAGSTFVWSCSTLSTNSCPDPTATSAASFSSHITYTPQDFSVDTYTLTLTVSWTDPNYAMPGGATSTSYSITFPTTNSGS